METWFFLVWSVERADGGYGGGLRGLLDELETEHQHLNRGFFSELGKCAR